MVVVLLARWSRVLGRRTQRGLALACGFLRLLVVVLCTWHLFRAFSTTTVGVGG
tara:strand:+ start:98 stop:259 length:162 start_codon:yes stop_codon:yes gene_type:complete